MAPSSVTPSSDTSPVTDKDGVAAGQPTSFSTSSPAPLRKQRAKEDGETDNVEEEGEIQPPLPDEQPPLPDEPVPEENSANDDGWAPVWDNGAQAYYFFNRFTQKTQWQNPRVPEDTSSNANIATDNTQTQPAGLAGGYNPAIHGDYDPNADYAIKKVEDDGPSLLEQYQAAQKEYDPNDPNSYAANAQFNRFTGRFQNDALHPTHTAAAHTDDAKSKRQMNAFFDVDAAANAHNGRSLKAERQNRKLTKDEVRAFREKRRERKEEKRRAWLRD